MNDPTADLKAAALQLRRSPRAPYEPLLAAWLEDIAEQAERHAAKGWGNDASEITDGHPAAIARTILDPGSGPDKLRRIVRTEIGEWTVRRASSVLLGLGHDFTAERIRQILNTFADEGLLIKHGERGRLWTYPAAAAGLRQLEPEDSTR